MSRKYVYQRKTDRLNRSMENLFDGASDADPYKLLAAAIIFQAAADCQNYSKENELPTSHSSYRNGLKYLRFVKLREFINSDWIDMLLSWQTEIKPEAVCEELARRLSMRMLQ